MDSVQNLIDNNRAWAAQIQRREPDFFSRLARDFGYTVAYPSAVRPGYLRSLAALLAAV